MNRAVDYQELQNDYSDTNSLSGTELPHLAATFFCVSDKTEKVLDNVIIDRRMVNVTSKVIRGSIEDAITLYQGQTTPNLLVIEEKMVSTEFIKKLDELANVCDAETKVVIIGENNDIKIYRNLIEKGIEDYLVTPISTKSFLSLLQGMYADGEDGISGRVIAFMGVKGGSGSSVLAQDYATTVANHSERPTILIDLDLHFGSAALNLDVELNAVTKNYLDVPEVFDLEIFNRVISKRGKYLSVFSGPEDAFGVLSISPDLSKKIIKMARQNFSYVVLDLPCVWNELTRSALLLADEVLIVATPELTSLRNARRLFQAFKNLRPNDDVPSLILNTCSMPKRKEVSVKKFAEVISTDKVVIVPFDPATFGHATLDGKSIGEVNPKSKAHKQIVEFVNQLDSHTQNKKGLLSRLFSRR